MTKGPRLSLLTNSKKNLKEHFQATSITEYFTNISQNSVSCSITNRTKERDRKPIKEGCGATVSMTLCSIFPEHSQYYDFGNNDL